MYKEFRIDKGELIAMVENRYQTLIPAYKIDYRDYVEEAGMTQLKNMLYSVISRVPLYQLPLYVNNAPEIARWRFLIGV
jgi:hypothetical protein